MHQAVAARSALSQSLGCRRKPTARPMTHTTARSQSGAMRRRMRSSSTAEALMLLWQVLPEAWSHGVQPNLPANSTSCTAAGCCQRAASSQHDMAFKADVHSTRLACSGWQPQPAQSVSRMHVRSPGRQRCCLRERAGGCGRQPGQPAGQIQQPVVVAVGRRAGHGEGAWWRLRPAGRKRVPPPKVWGWAHVTRLPQPCCWSDTAAYMHDSLLTCSQVAGKFWYII